VRRYNDTIDVRMQDVEMQDVSAVQPTAFVWRDRLYVVRAVQTRWYERRTWWREAAAVALLGLRGDDDGRDGRGEVGTALTARTSTVAAVLDTADYLDGETEVWRVEAAAGRSCPIGVFDLARPVSMTGAPSGGWRLTRVAD
jgi:hypothetical protein